MIKIEEISRYLKQYKGRELTFMEVCGSHTAAVVKYGIKDLLSERIHLISGPGCPVCVTPSAYIDRLITLAKEPNTCVVTFGDMLRVPGSRQSLSEAAGEGAKTKMVYSPMDMLALAEENPKITWIFAAVGFETTAPVYTLLLEEAEKAGLTNIRLLTALKTMPKVIEWLINHGAKVDGFLAPGHVCAVTGSSYFNGLAERYRIPFAVSGFKDTELLSAIYGLVRMTEKHTAAVKNFYPAAVEETANETAAAKLKKYFTECGAVWRGMGMIEDSGLCLKEEYRRFDAGSLTVAEDIKKNQKCLCGEILMGKKEPKDCPLFRGACTPGKPQGACMVSGEGSCYQHYIGGR